MCVCVHVCVCVCVCVRVCVVWCGVVCVCVCVFTDRSVESNAHHAATNRRTVVDSIMATACWLETVCFASTETMGNQDDHLDFHSAPGLCSLCFSLFHTSLSHFLKEIKRIGGAWGWGAERIIDLPK